MMPGYTPSVSFADSSPVNGGVDMAPPFSSPACGGGGREATGGGDA